MPNQEDLAEITSNAWKLAAQGKTLDLGVSYGAFGSQDPESEPTSFTYPLDMMKEKTDHLLIRIFNYERKGEIFGLGDPSSGSESSSALKIPGFTDIFNDPKTREKIEKTARYIFLPIPQQVSDAISVSYAEDRLNPAQAAGLKAAGSVLESSGLSDALKNAGNFGRAVLNDMKGVDAGTIQAVKAAAAGISINTLGANVSPTALITRASGQVLQSNLELLFSGVTLRSFPFVYDFVARDPREGEVIKGIIRTLKKSMTAKNGRDSLFIQSPDVFQLEYKTGNEMHPFLNSFKVCALSDLSVNYTGSGTYATYGDGTPVHIQVQMTFKEINPVYSEDYDVLSEGGYKNVGY